MKVHIFTEGDKVKGLGHVARCYALHQAFKDAGADPVLYINGDSESVSKVCGDNCVMCDWIADKADIALLIDCKDIVVIDSYHAEKDVYEELSAKAFVSLFFDDYERIDYPEGYIINPAVSRNEKFYGLKYAVLRKSFWDIKEKIINKDIKKILVALGSGAEPSYTEALLDEVVKEFDADVIPFAMGVKGSVYGLNDEETAELICSCDIAFTAGGQTMLELAACGVPSVLIKTADNQMENINSLVNEKAALYAGDINDISPEMLSNFAIELKDPDKRKNMSMKENMLVDGQGARLIVKQIIGEYNESF